MPANYVLLGEITTNASIASVTFSNIPQTGYTDLKIVMSARATRSGTDISTTAGITFNGITTAYYSDIMVEGGYGSTRSAKGSGQTFIGRNDIPSDDATASIFSNNEIYITNYTSSSYKSVLIDAVAENNGVGNYMYLASGAWNPPSNQAITSITFTALYTSTFDANCTFYLYGIAATGTTPVIAPKATGGDIVVNDGTYWYHAFLSSGTFTPSRTLSCDYLVVAGGGGASRLSGAGAGGLRSTVTATGGGGSLESAISVATATTVTIGAGGAGCVQTGGDTSLRGQNGSNSVFGSITSIGGGGGAGGNVAGFTGGSGGGGWNPGIGGAGTTGQGYAGGSAATYGGGVPYGQGGGGGAGAVGQASQPGNIAGTGGNGVQITAFATPTNTGANSGYYAGGGGASSDSSVVTKAGGLGGGGNGGGLNAGTINTGGGGGAQGGSNGLGGAGGSGIVIVRYTVA